MTGFTEAISAIAVINTFFSNYSCSIKDSKDRALKLSFLSKKNFAIISIRSDMNYTVSKKMPKTMALI